MKKNKTMVVVALAIALTLSIGYALFSQTINITGTATANGNFSFTAECSIGIHNDLANTDALKTAEVTAITTRYNTLMEAAESDTMPTVMAGGTNNMCTISGNTITMSSTLTYPGAMQMFTVKITNTGTISGKFNENSGLYNGGSSSSHGSGGTHILAQNNPAIYIDGVNQTPASLAQADGFEASLRSHEFAPGDIVYLVYSMYWGPESNRQCEGGCTDTTSYTLTFDQYNQ